MPPSMVEENYLDKHQNGCITIIRAFSLFNLIINAFAKMGGMHFWTNFSHRIKYLAHSNSMKLSSSQKWAKLHVLHSSHIHLFAFGISLEWIKLCLFYSSLVIIIIIKSIWIIIAAHQLYLAQTTQNIFLRVSFWNGANTINFNISPYFPFFSLYPASLHPLVLIFSFIYNLVWWIWMELTEKLIFLISIHYASTFN